MHNDIHPKTSVIDFNFSTKEVNAVVGSYGESIRYRVLYKALLRKAMVATDDNDETYTVTVTVTTSA